MTKKNDEQIELDHAGEVGQESQGSTIDQLRIELHEANEAKLRAMADFKNFQRRSVENESRASNTGIATVVRAIIPAIEQLNLAIEHSQDDSSAEGFEMARETLMRGLIECGVECIKPDIGDLLDPHLHETMMRQDAEGIEPEHIAMVMQQGYRLGDIVICPAKVAIST